MKVTAIFLLLVLFACSNGDTANATIFQGFEDPVSVTIQGYSDDSMEPFLSRDGSVLFFNNLNSASVNTNLHWCTRIDETIFQYQGELVGTVTEDLEGVPTMDADGKFYYVYTGVYEETLSTLFVGDYSNGVVTDTMLVQNLSSLVPGRVNFDVEISSDGQTMYFVDGALDQNGVALEANLKVAIATADGFEIDENSDFILQNVNTSDLEHAAAISNDDLELYFTRVAAPLNENSQPQIYRAARATRSEPFTEVERITNFDGFVEGATFSGRDLYYHKLEGEKFVLKFAKRRL